LNKNIEKVNLSGTTFKQAPHLWSENLNKRRGAYSSKYGMRDIKTKLSNLLG